MPQIALPPWLEPFRKQIESLPSDRQSALGLQVSQVDWDLVRSLVDRYVVSDSAANAPVETSSIAPAAFVPLPSTETDRKDRSSASYLGEDMLRAGRVAVLIVAGGQGSRLGFEGPKGTYPIGPVSGSSLFRFHARKVLALSRKYGRQVPLLLMTSPENDLPTKEHFQENGFFGLDPAQVRFFAQGQLPAVDRRTGVPLFAEPGKLALAPDGHGGCLYAMARKDPTDGLSALSWLEGRGVDTLFYYQVDNPMVNVADPVFLGLHERANAQVSFKIVAKTEPGEKVGVVCTLPSGRKGVIEYSDLPADLAEMRDSSGKLAYRAGSIAVHVFRLSFLRELVSGSTRLPFHKALKKVPCWDFETGTSVDPIEPNAVKFEAFIFDTLPMAERSVIVECDRTEEFEPLKNATGPDSPDTVRAALTRTASAALQRMGISVPRTDDGSPRFPIELDPCLAESPEVVRRLIGSGTEIKKPLSLFGDD